jgi:DNA-binding IclR family transcriptional regulator
MAQSYALVGTRATVLAAAGSSYPLVSVGVGMSISLVATAAGQVIATQLDPARLERLLPAEPFPNPLAELLANPGYVAFASGRFASGRFARASAADEAPLAVPRDRAQFDARLALVREQGYAIDQGDLHPEIGCIAVPWIGGTDSAALTCMGAPSEVAAAQELALRVLNAAVAPGATREDVVAAAARARDYSLAP